MKKGLKIALIIFVVIVAIVTAFAVWQWDNIKLLTYTDEDIAESNIRNSEDLKKDLSDYLGEEFRDFTEEELKAIREGNLSASQAVANILSEYSAQRQKPASDRKTENEITQEYTQKLSALQGKYMGQLQSLVSGAAKEYNAAVKSGEDKATAKVRIIRSYTQKALALESSCDSEFYGIVADLESDIKAIGADSSVVNSLKSAYANEKQSMKAKYMNRMK